MQLASGVRSTREMKCSTTSATSKRMCSRTVRRTIILSCVKYYLIVLKYTKNLETLRTIGR